MKRRRGTILTLLIVWGAGVTAARAEEPRSAYRLSYELDAPLLLIAGGVASSFLYMNETPPPACAPLCDRSNVNPLDRPFAGLYDRRWQTVGNIATVSVLLLVPAGLLVGEPSRAGLADLLVLGEAVLLTSAIQVTASYAVKRPRPRVYDDEAPLSERDDANSGRSFFSGHVANCMAGTMVAAVALRRIGRPRLAWAVLTLGLVGTGVVAVSRIASGGHFPSDVLVGYAVGTGVGIAIPALHEHKLEVAPLALPGVAGLTLAGRF